MHDVVSSHLPLRQPHLPYPNARIRAGTSGKIGFEKLRESALFIPKPRIAV